MNSNLILDFLRQLEQNNNAAWFHKYRPEYETARQEWLGFTQKILGHLGQKNPEFFQTPPHKCIFRINRDVRFSKNKSPYKNNFGAFFVPGGKNSGNAGYYVHLEPRRCAIAGGIHSPDKDKLESLRQRLLHEDAALPKIIKNKLFVQLFEDIDRTNTLKRRPNRYDETHPNIDLIRLKSFTVWKPISDAQTNEANFYTLVCDHFDVMDDFITWLNQ